MQPAISQVCTLQAPWQRDLEDYASAACPTVELWLGKLETYLESHTVDQARALLDQHQLRAPVASFQGGLLITQAQARREHWQLFRRRLDICRQLGVETLVVAGDLLGPLEQHDLERAQLSLVEAGQAAAEHGLRIAFEFQAKATFANNLETAAALVGACGSPHVGLCLDAFHFQVGPSKTEDLAYLSSDNLFHVQVSDLAGVAREVAADADRILPGDGDLPLSALVAALRSIGYQGCVSLELMNPQIWRIAPQQVAEIGMTALRKLLGQATMT